MKKLNYLKFILLLILISGCSSTKLANTYKSENFSSIKGQNILVVSRTPQEKVRKAYEREISKQLKAQGLNATPSHLIFPDLQPLTDKTVERIASTIAMFRDEGFDILLLTSLKDVQEQEVLKREEGYGSLLDYYGNKYLTLKGYYDDVSAPPRLEPRELERQDTYANEITYVLEAVTYNLGLEEEKRLLSVITAEITNPDTGNGVRKGFAKIISKNLQ